MKMTYYLDLFKLGTIDIHTQDILKMQQKDGVTELVFVLYALYSKCFLLNFERSVRNQINRKNCCYVAKATEYY